MKGTLITALWAVVIYGLWLLGTQGRRR